MPVSKRGEIHIIGRGIIGLSIGYRLIKSGWKISMIGPAKHMGTASYAAVGVSAVKGIILPRKPLFAAKLRGHYGLKSWLQEIENDSGYKINHHFNGAFEPFKNLKGYGEIRDRVFHRMPTGAYRMDVIKNTDKSGNFRLLVGNQMLPTWASGTYYYPEDGWFNPPMALKALEMALQQRGATFLDEPVQKITPRSENGFWIEMATQKLPANEPILAAGIFANAILENSGITHLTQKAVHGQTLTGKNISIKNSILIHKKLNMASFEGDFRYGSSSYTRTQLEPTLDELAPDQKLTAGLACLVGESKPLECQALWGIRAQLTDRAPAIGKVYLTKDRPFWVALGYYKNGMQLADLTAKYVDSCFNNQADDSLFKSFLPDRFAFL